MTQQFGWKGNTWNYSKEYVKPIYNQGSGVTITDSDAIYQLCTHVVYIHLSLEDSNIKEVVTYKFVGTDIQTTKQVLDKVKPTKILLKRAHFLFRGRPDRFKLREQLKNALLHEILVDIKNKGI